MIQCRLSYRLPQGHIIDFEIVTETNSAEYTDWQFAARRPGRYELLNFAQYIRKFEAFSEDGRPLPFRQLTKDRWRLFSGRAERIRLRYEFLANQGDAGGSVLNEEMLYVNWINCVPLLVGRENEALEMSLEIPDNYLTACALPGAEDRLIRAENYYRLSDSPLFAAPNLETLSYKIPESETNFQIVFLGYFKFDKAQVLADFRQFTSAQVQLFGEFPEPNYLFLIWIKAEQSYHGVEHSASTVITMGPGRVWDRFYKPHLLGISSHELFHAWNAMKIIPEELANHDYSRSTAFETGFVIEGLTTYYGDYLLARCGLWSEGQYLNELNTNLRRHFENFGRFNSSLAESSAQLWLDGYRAGMPDRKVSIYNEGCLFSWVIDLKIRSLTKNIKSLDDLMRLLWKRFGKTGKGYSLADYVNAAEEVAGSSLAEYFDDFLFGRGKTEPYLTEAAGFIGCVLEERPADSGSEKNFGIRFGKQNDIVKIAPGSPADKQLAFDDLVLSINGRDLKNGRSGDFDGPEIELVIYRNFKRQKIVLEADGKRWFSVKSLVRNSGAPTAFKNNFENWIGKNNAL